MVELVTPTSELTEVRVFQIPVEHVPGDSLLLPSSVTESARA